ncbi:acyl-CoA thioesterase [Legionella erythra]|uniref:Acyl-CoA thioesterase YbgC n=1 Tax=Legionella erythra TaxID=448 RepID=A0A0W0TWZ9_LEGER|nr:acyl-CoA thioesterase YbgC [Legionella erythra]
MFKIELEVRDYECDIQGIVNNANYQHYFEHARHLFLYERGIDFLQLAQKDIFLVMYRCEIDYRKPLTYKTKFEVSVAFERIARTKGRFNQQIMIDSCLGTRTNACKSMC